jgi:hypothetical protein
MTRPYHARACAQPQADNTRERLRRHWSSRCWRIIQRAACHMEGQGLNAVANLWLTVTGPLCDWLAHRQCVFLQRSDN